MLEKINVYKIFYKNLLWINENCLTIFLKFQNFLLLLLGVVQSGEDVQ